MKIPFISRWPVVILPLVVVTPLLGDWVTLRSGKTLRGLDLRKRGQMYRFTLEDGNEISFRVGDVTSVRKSAADETVEFRGKRVTLREKIRTLQAEERVREKRAIRDLDTWARGKKAAGAARDRFQALPEKAREKYLATALAKSSLKKTRLLAAQQMAGARDARLARLALSQAAIHDSYRSVRDTCLRYLKIFRDPTVGDSFIPYLRSSSPEQRLRAANALSVFPRRRAVPVILDTMRLTYSGFGRGFFSQITQRAYIADYELVSGGTGFSIIEVADPIVATSQTGVALDIDVRKVEVIARLRALTRITGKDYGTDFDRWRRWWREEGSKETP